MLQFLYISWFFCFQILCIGNSREDRTNLQHASSTSGLWSPVAKGQTLQTLQTLQTRKSSPTLKTPTRKRQSIQLELSPSEQYTSTSGLWSPVAKGQTLQTRKSSPTLKTPTTKRQSIQLELSPSEQYTRVTKIWSPIDCISPQSKNQSLHLVWPPQDQYTFADDKAVTTSSNHSSTSGLWSPVPKVPKGHTSLGHLKTRKTPSKFELSPSEQYTSTSGLWSPVAKGQTLQTLQTRKSSPTLKTPTRKRPSIQLELSPSEQYTVSIAINFETKIEIICFPAFKTEMSRSSNHSVRNTINSIKLLFI
ncbi:DNA-directed RNA polymerase II subunit RPB1-like isoform X1 [Mytilus edulis]|uniref:DNA-directed RNA polymerase II subunit RPB1-like isoform X1 n=1 Tax=Mytilus edulis TaxID=6550 RepID=UPI0039F11220